MSPRPSPHPVSPTTLPEGKTVLVMDGDCALCSRAARVIANADGSDIIRICTSQSPLGRALLSRHGLDPDDPESWLVHDQGRVRQSLRAVVHVARHLSGWPRLLIVLGWLPTGLQDWLYRRIARNRYALFGRTDMCALPDPELKRRLLG